MTAWIAIKQYNELAQEIERKLPGEVVSQWQYDSTGRPTNHRVSSQSRFTRRRAYQWGANHRLKGIVNELTGVRTAFDYDEFSNLVWSNEGGQFDFIHRSVDEVGNLYETKDKKDRVYGAGSRLLETTDATFSYDEEGNLVQKVEKNSGDTWRYEYTGNGMLAKVVKPDRTVVTFKYDALGRRVEKRSSEKTTTFIWDGNTIFHEYFLVDYSEKLENFTGNSTQHNPERPANLVTWVFNDGFVPSAKLTNEGNYSIISDYLGTPVEAYDDQGTKVWSAELDIYGRVQEFTGEQDFIPFRYQGQYEDVEIGLYYNRFRYYDPAQGNYTQVAPIGLAGGNPTLYGYVSDPNNSIDRFGLAPKFPILPGVNLSKLNLIMYKPTKVTPVSGTYRTGIERAWELERGLVVQTGSGTYPWNAAELEELKTSGKVRGYAGHHITNHKNGSLGEAWKGDPRNIRFLPNAAHSGGYDEHLYGERGHRGHFGNATTGRLIDRQAMIDRHNSGERCKKR